MADLGIAQSIRLEAAQILSRQGDPFDVWDVLSLAYTIQTGKVKSREELVQENREKSDQ